MDFSLGTLFFVWYSFPCLVFSWVHLGLLVKDDVSQGDVSLELLTKLHGHSPQLLPAGPVLLEVLVLPIDGAHDAQRSEGVLHDVDIHVRDVLLFGIWKGIL